jgi:uncharacterized protein
MDVSLVLTHRCNLACGYCYAGEHYRKDMDDATLERAVDMLFADDADTVQLSFFGGEPFLSFDSMQRAVALAETRTSERGRRLLLQCTTNGSVLRDEHVQFIVDHDIRTTVSIDGVREAHDLNRPCAGGGSSFDRVRDGLRKLVGAGARPDAMMVISPETAPYTYSSVSFLWGEGVRRVRANMVLDAPWTAQDRDELREQLLSVGWEKLARRTRGEDVTFEPFESGMRRAHKRRPVAAGAVSKKRAQVVVGATGFLYPCAPMVGEDRDDGPEAALRLGHLDDGREAALQRVACDGAGCGDGGGCACAAYLETGDRRTPGPNGRWYAAVCAELGAAIATALDAHLYPPRPEPDDGSRRRPFLIGMAAAVGGLAIGVPALLRAGLFGSEAPGCDETTSGSLAVPEPAPPVPGGLMAPEVAPPEPEVAVGGNMKPEPEPEIMVKGDIAAPEPPPPEPKVHTRGGVSKPEPEPEEKEIVLGDML